MHPDGWRDDGFAARWRRAWESKNFFALQGTLLMRLGVAKRVSKCRMCLGPVVAGEARVEFFLRHGWKNYAKGGSSGQVYYVHTGCMQKFLDGNQPELLHAPGECVGCHRIIERVDGYYPGLPFIVSAALMSHICKDCAELPMYRMCVHCGLWSYKTRMTKLVHDPGQLCYHCDDELEVTGRGRNEATVRSVKRDGILLKKVQKGYDEAGSWISELRAAR